MEGRNCENIRIWHDRWIPRPYTYMVQTPPNLLAPDSRVADLIDLEKH